MVERPDPKILDTIQDISADLPSFNKEREPLPYTKTGEHTQRPKKSGILPYYRDATGTAHYLVHAPKPVRNPGDIVDFGIARGSRSLETPNGEWVDLRTQQEMDDAPEEILVPEALTALVEAQEELGLSYENCKTLQDCGAWEYKDYIIHLYLTEVRDPDDLVHLQDNGYDQLDSAKIAWKTAEELREMTKDTNKGRGFKEGYLPMIDTVDRYLHNAKEKGMVID